MNLKKVVLTYNDIQNGFPVYDDRYEVLSYALREDRIKAFYDNPNMIDRSKPMLRLYVDDNIIVARSMNFTTQVRIKQHTFPASSGSSLFVHEDYRQYGLGAELMLDKVRDKSEVFCLSAGLSSMVIPLYKVLKYTVFSFPIISLRRHSKYAFINRGFPSWLSSGLGRIIDFILRMKYFSLYRTSHKLCSLYRVEEVLEVPHWVDEIVLDSKYDFMEVHDRAWLQWNLDNSYHSDYPNRQGFYIVYRFNEPIAFFMITERKRDNKNIGRIVEWGIKGCKITEYNLILLALNSFNKDVDEIKVLTQDADVEKHLLKEGFVKNDHFEIAFKVLKKNQEDIIDVNKWRIRYGYADSIMSI